MGKAAAANGTNPATPQVAADKTRLADGAVTADEYPAALNRFIACAEQAGLTTAGPITTDHFGHLGVSFTQPGVIASAAAAQHLQQVTESCRRTYLDAVELAWVRAHPASAADSEAARNYTAGCLATAGIAIDAAPSKNALSQAIMSNITNPELRPKVVACLNHTATQFNWPGYAGS